MAFASASNVRRAFKPIYDAYKEKSKKDPKLMPRTRFKLIFPDELKWRDVGILPAGDVVGPHANLRKFLIDWKLTGVRRTSDPTTVESHHLLEDHLMIHFGISRDEGLCVALEQMDHAIFSAQLPGHLARKKAYDIDDVFDAHRIMYTENGHRDWVPLIAGWLEKIAPRILAKYDRKWVKNVSEDDKKRIRAFFAGLVKYR